MTHLQRLYMLLDGLDNFLAVAMTNAVSHDLFKWFEFCSLWREFCFSAKLWLVLAIDLSKPAYRPCTSFLIVKYTHPDI